MPVFRLGLGMMAALGRSPGLGKGFLARTRQDLVYDGDPARAALGHAPRGFRPGPAAFPPVAATQHPNS